MVRTNARKGKPPIECPLCNETKKDWNIHHFGPVKRKDQAEKICVDCHDDINYYMSKFEQERYLTKDIKMMKILITKRKKEYCRNPPAILPVTIKKKKAKEVIAKIPSRTYIRKNDKVELVRPGKTKEMRKAIRKGWRQGIW
jgi:hypothetical protein